MARLPLPARFGKYVLIERLNVGGMAEIYYAKSFGAEGFEKIVAIKKILPHISEDETFITMFIDEARIASRLQHSNIAQIYDFGEYGGEYFQVMEYIPGRDLKYIARTLWAKGTNLPIGATLYIITRVAEGLDYAHSLTDGDGNPLNIIHRDVTPANILVSYDGNVKIIDFGIAKAKERSTKTQAGIVKGKFSYMPPEQLKGKELDNRADLFALGVVLWELLTGERLFNEPNDLDTLRKIVAGNYPLPSEFNPAVPPILEEVVMKALAYDREERYATGEELAMDLTRVAYELGEKWNTSTMARYMKETFRKEYEEELKRREKALSITKEMVESLPSAIEDDEDVEFLDEDELILEEEPDEDMAARNTMSVAGEIGSDSAPSLTSPMPLEEDLSGGLELDEGAAEMVDEDYSTESGEYQGYGYYDENGNWIPTQPSGDYSSQYYGYYDENGNWIPTQPSGYYDENGNWIPTQPSGDYSSQYYGYYDENGNWIPTQPSQTEASAPRRIGENADEGEGDESSDHHHKPRRK